MGADNNVAQIYPYLRYPNADPVTPASVRTLRAPALCVPDLETFLAGRLANRVVCVYDVARGFVFPHGESHKREFVRRSGLAEQAEQSGAMAALQAAGGGPQPNDADLPRGPAQALPLIEEFLTADVSGDEALPAVVLLTLEAIVPNAPWAQLSPAERETIVRLQRWGRDFAGIANAGAIVIGIVRNVQDLHESLRSAANRWEAIEVPIPNKPAERFKYMSEDSSRRYLYAVGEDIGDVSDKIRMKYGPAAG